MPTNDWETGRGADRETGNNLNSRQTLVHSSERGDNEMIEFNSQFPISNIQDPVSINTASGILNSVSRTMYPVSRNQNPVSK